MEFRKMARAQLILAGLAATLAFTPLVRSQEITNTAFDDGPNVTTFAQQNTAQPSAQPTATQGAVPSVNQVESIQASLSTPHVALIDSPWVAAGLTAILFAVIALSAVSESKRVRRNYATRRYPSYHRA